MVKMYKIVLFIFCSISLQANYIQANIIDVDYGKKVAKVKLEDKVDIGVSGVIVHKIAKGVEVIVNNVEVVDFNATSKIAVLRLKPHIMFKASNLPDGRWRATKGDLAILAFGYNRALIISQSEDNYYRIKSALKGESFAHPDIFATFLSSKGHPTPLKEDFEEFCKNLTIGLIFFQIEKKIYTTDCLSFKVLSVSDFPFETKDKKLPFYSRVPKIEANWFGEGSDYLKDYAPHYYKLLLRENRDNANLLRDIKSSNYKNILRVLE